MNIKCTDRQKQRLKILAGELRKIAAPVGTLHAWWDLIFDIEAFLEGRETLLKMTADEFISEAEQYFIDAGMTIPNS